MKKTALLFSIFAASFTANAQLTLTGASPYTQDFNSLSSGLPTGWVCYNTATSTSLGTLDASFGPATAWGAYYDTTDCPSDVFGTGFKNSASANGGASLLAASTCATQESQSDRCLSVRQSSNTSHPGFDPGPAFCLHLSGTTGMTEVGCTFKLQSLDQLSPRVTTWMVDYGFGATPTSFTAASTTGTMTTGGSAFTNNSVSVTFGSALDNKATDVWIRISTQSASTGSGSRATSGIDDFSLTWSGTAYPTGVQNVNEVNGMTLVVAGEATSNKVNFQFVTNEAASYELILSDMTGRIVSRQTVNAVAGTQQVSANGLNLTHGLYMAALQNANAKAVVKFVVE
jgi:hypothetical protein